MFLVLQKALKYILKILMYKAVTYWDQVTLNQILQHLVETNLLHKIKRDRLPSARLMTFFNP